MLELVDTFPDVNVEPGEYARLLGYPRDHVLAGRARELSQWAKAWYGKHGRPWIYARQCQSLHIAEGQIDLDGERFSSPRLQKTLQEAEASSAFLVAVSAGPEAETQAHKLWLEEKPDEYFFLEIYGSAVVEYLATLAGARLCAWGDRNTMAVLPHYSPGYPEWDIAQQPRFLDLLRRGAQYRLPDQIHAMSTGMLQPKKSLLAVFGVTTHVERVQRLTDLVPCENCSFANCQYRRVPYARGQRAEPEVEAIGLLARQPARTDGPAKIPHPLDKNAAYLVNPNALQRWAGERLTLTDLADGSIEALFKYEGTTCSNMGRPIHFHYHIKLAPRSEGYLLKELLCQPAPGDEGHTFMCRYMSNAEHLMVAIDHEKPLLGKPLNDILTWKRPAAGAGCYCEPASRQHKWGLVLETLHYALVKRESSKSI